MLACFLGIIHKTRKKLVTCTQTWMYMCTHSCQVAGGSQYTDDWLHWSQWRSELRWRKDSKELSQRRILCVIMHWVKQAVKWRKRVLSKPKNIIFNPATNNSLQTFLWIFSVLISHAFFLLVLDYSTWATDLVWAHRSGLLFDFAQWFLLILATY